MKREEGGVLMPSRKRRKRPTGLFQRMMRSLRAHGASKDVDAEPRPECSRSVNSGGTTYCTSRIVREDFGAGAALRCIGERCGDAELPPEPDDDYAG